MGIVHCKRGAYEDALENFKEALRVKEVELDRNHPEVASTLFQIGIVFDSWNKHDLAIDYFEQSVRIRRSKLGEDNLLVAKT